MNLQLSLEDQIRHLADAEFASTEPAQLDRHRRGPHWWFAAAAAAVLLVAMALFQLGRRDAAIDTPVIDDPQVEISAPEGFVPEVIRDGQDQFRWLTQGDTVLAAGRQHVWASQDRGVSWAAPGFPPALLDTWCPPGSTMAVNHAGGFAQLTARESGDRSAVAQTVYLMDETTGFESLPIPTNQQEHGACGIASDGETLVVSRLNSDGQIAMLVKEPGSAPFDVRDAFTIPLDPIQVGYATVRYDGRWIAAACAITPATTSQCRWQLWDVSDLISGDGPATTVPSGGTSWAVNEGELWLAGIETHGSDYSIGDTVVAYGDPWVSGLGARSTTLPGGVVFDVTFATVGDELIATTAGRFEIETSVDGYDDAAIRQFALQANDSWQEIEPLEQQLVAWSASGSTDFAVLDWTPDRGLVGWPRDGSLPAPKVNPPTIDVDSLVSLDFAALGEVQLRATVEQPLLYSADGVAWEPVEVSYQGVPLESVTCIDWFEGRFHLTGFPATAPHRQSFTSRDGLTWVESDDRYPGHCTSQVRDHYWEGGPFGEPQSVPRVAEQDERTLFAGTIGSAPVTLWLAQDGLVVRGELTYDAVGAPIVVAGFYEPNTGGYVVSEFDPDGNVTGLLRFSIASDGSLLDQAWTDPAIVDGSPRDLGMALVRSGVEAGGDDFQSPQGSGSYRFSRPLWSGSLRLNKTETQLPGRPVEWVIDASSVQGTSNRIATMRPVLARMSSMTTLLTRGVGDSDCETVLGLYDDLAVIWHPSGAEDCGFGQGASLAATYLRVSDSLE